MSNKINRCRQCGRPLNESEGAFCSNGCYHEFERANPGLLEREEYDSGTQTFVLIVSILISFIVGVVGINFLEFGSVLLLMFFVGMIHFFVGYTLASKNNHRGRAIRHYYLIISRVAAIIVGILILLWLLPIIFGG